MLLFASVFDLDRDLDIVLVAGAGAGRYLQGPDDREIGAA